MVDRERQASARRNPIEFNWFLFSALILVTLNVIALLTREATIRSETASTVPSIKIVFIFYLEKITQDPKFFVRILSLAGPILLVLTIKNDIVKILLALFTLPFSFWVIYVIYSESSGNTELTYKADPISGLNLIIILAYDIIFIIIILYRVMIKLIRTYRFR